MSRYKAYPEYRDSDLQWLGDMPSHWKLRKSKYIFSRVQRQVRPEDGVVTAFRDGQVTLRTNRRIDGFTESIKEIGYQGVRKGDLLVHAMDGFAGAIGVSDSDGKCSPVCSVCIPTDEKEVHVGYFGYLVRQLAVTDYISSLAKGIRERSTEFRYSEFSVLDLALPPKNEQKTITAFLDHEIAKIDALIEKQQRLIELLKEKRQAVISHAVTKGLNPNAPMKDSGVEWLGEVPTHWKITQIKFEAELNPKKVNVDLTPSLECSFVPMEKLKTDSLLLDEIRSVADVYAGYTCFCNDDVLMAKVTPCFENKNIAVAHGLTNGVGFGSTEIYVLRAGSNINNYFLLYRLQENEFMNISTAAMTGAGGLKRVPTEIVNNFRFALPPLKEQLDICAYLEVQKKKFGVLEEFAKNQVELLQERRTALISAAVTGKIDVRDWQPAAA